jgi:hypothetical protein
MFLTVSNPSEPAAPWFSLCVFLSVGVGSGICYLLLRCDGVSDAMRFLRAVREFTFEVFHETQSFSLGLRSSCRLPFLG